MMSEARAILNNWLAGVRFYIAIAIILVTLETWWWASTSYAGSSLFVLRLEEAYAWLSLALLSIAISIGPLYKVFYNLPGRLVMANARRLIGIGAAWFASLHGLVAYASLFKWTAPYNLPRDYQHSFGLAVVALIILLAMAFTSFDRAFAAMGVWWFRLHRFVYLAVLVSLLHAFITGVHATEGPVLAGLVVAASTVFVMHLYIAFVRPGHPSIWQLLALAGVLVLMLGIFNYGFMQKGRHDISRPRQLQS